MTSAVTGEGVEEAFHQLISIIAPLKIESMTNPIEQPKQ
jgi:hypothetical protein